MLDLIFPKEVITVTTPLDGNMISGALYSEEEKLISRAAKKRKIEFTAGRLCSRKALKQLGIKQFPILIGNAREPLWPAQITGSISHCDDYCGAALAHQKDFRSIGLDIESITPLESEVLNAICTPAEQEWSNCTPPPPDSNWPKIIFSMKECVYKCLFPLIQTFIDFHQVSIKIDPTTMRFSAHLEKELLFPYGIHTPIIGRFAYNSQHIFTGMVIKQKQPPIKRP